MAPRKQPDKAPPGRPKAAIRAEVTKKRYPKVRKLENGLFDVTRKTGKYRKIMERNRNESPLLRLPGELRNQIFEYVLDLGYELRTSNSYIKRRGMSPIVHAGKRNALSLLHVCRQLYDETTILPYTLNTFTFHDLYDVDLWIRKTLPCQLETIKSVGICASWAWSDALNYYDLDSQLISKLPGLRKLKISINQFAWILHCLSRPQLEDSDLGLRQAEKNLERMIKASYKNLEISLEMYERI
ncbi:hypothetical protein CC78DRAFT_596414 [Lojkania enalia]|uniref:Uncharacterized protein n=1 Tax=Lojkania enalia TaxID=147567 RepID=A0A9P4NCI4_9PLEO|nr:hypothetical protein CC78DRAFT_596414 [Didymosphaeria enalia]